MSHAHRQTAVHGVPLRRVNARIRVVTAVDVLNGMSRRMATGLNALGDGKTVYLDVTNG